MASALKLEFETDDETRLMSLFLDHGADPHLEQLRVVLKKWSEDTHKEGHNDQREEFTQKLENRKLKGSNTRGLQSRSAFHLSKAFPPISPPQEQGRIASSIYYNHS